MMLHYKWKRVTHFVNEGCHFFFLPQKTVVKLFYSLSLFFTIENFL